MADSRTLDQLLQSQGIPLSARDWLVLGSSGWQTTADGPKAAAYRAAHTAGWTDEQLVAVIKELCGPDFNECTANLALSILHSLEQSSPAEGGAEEGPEAIEPQADRPVYLAPSSLLDPDQEGRVAEVEPAASRLPHQVRGHARFFWLLTCLGFGTAIALTPVGGVAAFLGWFVGGALVGLLSAILAVIMTFRSRQIARHIARMEQGQCLAHWTYQPEEWRQFARIDWRLMRKYAWLTAAGVAVLGASAAFLASHPGDDNRTGLPAAAWAGAFIGCAVGGCVGGWAAWHWYHGWRRYRRAKKGVGLAYLDTGAVYFNGEYHPWGGTSRIRLSALDWVDEDPSYLQFTFEFARTPVAAAGHAGTSQMPNKVFRVPVPAGREGEAKAFPHRFSG